jgi:hypothetical protein
MTLPVFAHVATRVAVGCFAIIVAAPVLAQNAPNVSLPPAVATAFQKAFSGAAISRVGSERDNSRVLYRVEAVDEGRRRSVWYDANGALIQVAEQVAENELPRPVAAAMHSHPRAIYASGLKVTRGGRIEYQLTLRGTRKTAMVVKPDGTVVSFK